MHQSLAKFSESEASNHTPSLGDFTTTTPELKFSVHTSDNLWLELTEQVSLPNVCFTSETGGVRCQSDSVTRAHYCERPLRANSGRSLKVFTRGRARDGMLSRAKTPDTAAPMLAVALKLNQSALAATLRSTTAISQ